MGSPLLVLALFPLGLLLGGGFLVVVGTAVNARDRQRSAQLPLARAIAATPRAQLAPASHVQVTRAPSTEWTQPRAVQSQHLLALERYSDGVYR